MRFAFDFEVAIVCALLLTWNWRSVLMRPHKPANWRQKSAMIGLMFATGAAASFVIFALIRHSPGIFAPEIELRSLEFMGGLGIAGIIAAILGEGNPRVFAAFWSILFVLICFVEFGVAGH